ncbi:MAG: hypothetical protein CFH34_01025, partial [Alphaproteobacteria bacterium MarineAlpha9_Bin4]
TEESAQEVAEAATTAEEQPTTTEESAQINLTENLDQSESLFDAAPSSSVDGSTFQDTVLNLEPSATQEIESIEQIQSFAELEDQNTSEEADIDTEDDSQEQVVEDSEDEPDEVEIASADESSSEDLDENQGIGFQIEDSGENQLFGSSMSPVSSSVLSAVASSSGSLNFMNASNIGVSAGISSLGGLSPVSSSLPLMGENNLQGTLIETSSFEEVITETESISEIEDTVDDGQITYNQLSEEIENEQSDEGNENQASDSAIINATNQNDTLIGGAGDTEFLYDFNSSSIGGNDVLSDQGNTSSDRIFFKNIPDNHAIWISRDESTSVGMRFETFDTNDPSPTSHNNSINTITTLISDGTSGIEDFYFTTDNTNYNSSSSFAYENFYNLGASNINNMAQLITGNSSNNSFLSDLPGSGYKWRFSDASEFSRSAQGYDSSIQHPYDASVLDARVFLTKGGADTLSITSNFHTQYIADMGDGNDTIKYSANGTSSPPIIEGSYFDGGLGSDSLEGSAVADHYGWNANIFTESIKPTNASILKSQGSSSLISSIDSSYFDNFETINSNEGNDTFYFGGDPGNDMSISSGTGQDKFDFNFALTSNVTAFAGDDADTFNINISPSSGAELTLRGKVGNDQFNFNTNIDNTLLAYGGKDNDTFEFQDSNINGNLLITTGLGNDIIKFNSENTGNNLEITDFSTGEDTFEFSSAAFNGKDGHVLVFGAVNTLATGIKEFVASNNGGIQAFDQTDAQIGINPGTDLLSRNDDVWLYDTNTGLLYYDEDADQIMDDAITIAEVNDSGSVLGTNSLKSSDITYDIT